MNSADLSAWLEWQQTLSPHEIELGLERVHAVLARLALTLPDTVITVGGTNGKGSTVVMLESLLGEFGSSVGAYTSPHVFEYKERIRVRGKPVSDERIVTAFRRIESVRAQVPLTYFEYGTLAALCVFSEAALDAAILEVGLGGRLDAVNAVDADAVVLTSIELDHQDWLGRTREAIATEKAPIMRAGRPAIFAGTNPPSNLVGIARDIGATLAIAGDAYRVVDRGERWDWHGSEISLRGLSRPSLSGAHQIGNAAGALAVLEALGYLAGATETSVSRALENASLPARIQILGSQPAWIVDGAHNPDAGRALAAALDGIVAGERTLALAGFLDDKDVLATLAALQPKVDLWFAATPESARAIPAGALAATIANATGQPCQYFDTIEEAVEGVQRIATAADRVVVFGSFFLAGPVLKARGLYSATVAAAP